MTMIYGCDNKMLCFLSAVDSTRVNHDIYLSLILSRYAATPQGETIELYHTGYGLTTSG
jgi:hypothetical protein